MNAKIKKRFWSKVKKTKDCWIWVGGIMNDRIKLIYKNTKIYQKDLAKLFGISQQLVSNFIHEK